MVDPESLNLDQVKQLCKLKKKSRCAKARDGGASLEDPWCHFLAWGLKMLRNTLLEAAWGNFLACWLKILKNMSLEAPWGHFQLGS